MEDKAKPNNAVTKEPTPRKKFKLQNTCSRHFEGKSYRPVTWVRGLVKRNAVRHIALTSTLPLHAV